MEIINEEFKEDENDYEAGKINIKISKTKKDFENFDIDKLLDFKEKGRKINEYYGIYKIQMLIASGSGGGKTTFAINNILNGIIPSKIILLFCPFETYTSGFWYNIIHHLDSLNEKYNLDLKLIIFDISRGNNFTTFDDYMNYGEGILYKGFPTLNKLIEFRNNYLKKSKDNNSWLLIFDDFVNNFNSSNWEEYYRYVHNISRMNGNMMSLVQSITSIPPQVRSSYTIIVLFTNYLADSVTKSLIKNCWVNNLTSEQINELLRLTKMAKGDQKHIPLILIGSTAPVEKNIIYNNKFITFEN